MKKRKAPKCISCGKNLKRNSKRYIDEKEPYKGNMICYNKKTNPPTPDEKSDCGKFIFKGRAFPEYDYTLWDGESYWYFWGRYRFCGVNCAARYGISKLPKHEKPKERLSKTLDEMKKIYPDRNWYIHHRDG